MVQNKELDEVTSTINLNILDVDSIFMFAANSINSYQELKFLLNPYKLYNTRHNG